MTPHQNLDIFVLFEELIFLLYLKVYINIFQNLFTEWKNICFSGKSDRLNIDNLPISLYIRNLKSRFIHFINFSLTFKVCRAVLSRVFDISFWNFKWSFIKPIIWEWAEAISLIFIFRQFSLFSVNAQWPTKPLKCSNICKKMKTTILSKTLSLIPSVYPQKACV